MKKSISNPYKYATIVLVVLIVILMIIRGYDINYSLVYSISAISIMLYLGWKLTVVVNESRSKRGFVLSLILYTLMVSGTLGPILFLVIPHYVDKYLFANIIEIRNHDKRHMRTFIWNSPVDGVKLSSGVDYIFNNSADTVYLVSATYKSTKTLFPYGDGGVHIQRTLYPHDFIKNDFKIYLYFEELPDTITARMRRFDTSSRTYYFILSKDQYNKELYYQSDEVNEDGLLDYNF